MFRRRRQLHHAVVSLDGRERVRCGPSRPATHPLAEPPHVQPPGVIAEQQRRRRRPRSRLQRPTRARLRPLFLPLRGRLRRRGPRSSARHRQRGALRHAHHPHGMPFTKFRSRVRQQLRVVTPREQDGTPRVSTPAAAARRRRRRGHRQRAHVVRVRSFRPREGPSVHSLFVRRDSFKRRHLRVDARGEDDVPVGRRGDREDVRAVLSV